MRSAIASVITALVATAPAAANADTGGLQAMIAVGGTFDLPLWEQQRLTDVGPGLQVMAGVSGPPSQRVRPEFFLRYGVQRTAFSKGVGAPEPVVRHDVGLGFGFIRDGDVAAGAALTSELRFGGGSYRSIAWDAGPLVRFRMGDHLAIGASASLNLSPVSVVGPALSHKLALRLGSSLVAMF